MLTTRLGRLDTMQWIGDTSLWDEMSENAIADEIAGMTIRIVGYQDLVRLKELAGRPEDLAGPGRAVHTPFSFA